MAEAARELLEVVSGRETSRIFIENGRFHGEMIIKAVQARRARA